MSRPRVRDDYRLRGLIGPTNSALGTQWDKGHFIGHALGGAVDRLEINVFIQRRDINRGWSELGKRFRALEQYCVDHPGTFCFSRPFYADGFSRPAFLDFGLIDQDGVLCVERTLGDASGKARMSSGSPRGSGVPLVETSSQQMSHPTRHLAA
jgi:hypothetical protein